MHEAVVSYVARHIPPAVMSVLEFGSRNLNGSVRFMLPVPTYVGVDLYEGPDVDIVGNAATVDLGQQFDLVACTELFEHADDDTCAAIIANAHRHLVEGGTFIATMAGIGRAPHSAIEAVPNLQPGEFYRNVDRDLLASWLTAAGFIVEDINVEGLDIRCTATKEVTGVDDRAD